MCPTLQAVSVILRFESHKQLVIEKESIIYEKCPINSKNQDAPGRIMNVSMLLFRIPACIHKFPD